MTAGGRRRWPWIVAVAAVVAVGVVVGVVMTGDDSSEAADATVRLNTSEVVTKDLVEQTSYSGTLGRVAGEPVSTAKEGTITWLPDAGSTIGNGDVLFEVDGVPVVALIGDEPIYRDLTQWDSSVDVTAGVAGVVTDVPEAGDVVGQGSVLFEVDAQPIVALIGDVPAYRDLRDERTDLVGDDVAQLETALSELDLIGDIDMTVDDTFTGATASAVEALQESIGADEDGELLLGEYRFIDAPKTILDVDAEIGDTVNDQTVIARFVDGDPMSGVDVAQLQSALTDLGYDDSLRTDGVFDDATTAAIAAFESAVGLDADGSISLGEAIFIPSPIRVSDLAVSLGQSVSPGAPVLNVTGEDVGVTMDLPSEDQGLLEIGQAVTVELPNNRDVDATVSDVATVATVVDGSAVFAVTIALDDSSVASGLDEAPVDVLVVTDSAPNATAVPVSALVVLREGGYAVEKMVNDVPTLIAVEPGFFADGYVEIDGDLTAGDLVIVP